MSLGVAATLVYVLVVMTVMIDGRDGHHTALHTMFPGMMGETAPRQTVSWVEVLLGAISSFGFAWVLGMMIAAVYNSLEKPSSQDNS